MPVEVLASRDLGACWKGQSFTQWWPPVVLPGQRVGLNSIGQRGGEVYAQPPVDRDQAGVEGHVMGWTGGQAVARVESFAGGAVLPWLDMPSQQHTFSAE